MHIVLILLLVVLFGYALMLVILNNAEIAVNLVFSQAPQMNLGLLLIISLIIGMLIGILTAFVMFRVVQVRLELARTKKELTQLKSRLDETTVALEQVRKGHTVADIPPVVVEAHSPIPAPTQIKG